MLNVSEAALVMGWRCAGLVRDEGGLKAVNNATMLALVLAL